jgi:hypothetical protein
MNNRTYYPRTKRFKLTERDETYLATLKRTAHMQYVALILYEKNPDIKMYTIAHNLGIPEETVKSRIYRAREKIIAWRKADLEELSHAEQVAKAEENNVSNSPRVETPEWLKGQ